MAIRGSSSTSTSRSSTTTSAGAGSGRPSRIASPSGIRVDPEEFQSRSYEFADRHYQLLLRGDIDYDTYRRDYVRHGLEPWGELDDDLYAAYSDARTRSVDLIELFADAVDTISGLRARGIKIGILTNGPSELQRRKLRLIGIEDEVDAVAVSEEIGVSKPDPEAYARAVEMLGLEPDEVAMVGDHVVNDVAGALAAGLAAAVWVERRPGEDLPRRRPPSTGAGRGAEAPRI